MYLILGLILGILTLVGLVRAWYQLVRWGETHVKPRFGDHQGFIISAVILPLALLILLAAATVFLGRHYGAYLFGGVMVVFAIYGLVWLYIRYCWR